MGDRIKMGKALDDEKKQLLDDIENKEKMIEKEKGKLADTEKDLENKESFYLTRVEEVQMKELTLAEKEQKVSDLEGDIQKKIEIYMTDNQTLVVAKANHDQEKIASKQREASLNDEAARIAKELKDQESEMKEMEIKAAH